MSKVLIICAHPDDEILGCGGTLEMHKAIGDEVSLCIGDGGRNDPIDQRFETLPITHWIGKVEDVVSFGKPDIVYTHCSSDINRDHRIINEAVMVATRHSSVKELYAFDVTSDWGFGQFGRFSPNVFVDITEYIDKKIKAMKTYREEIRLFPHYRSEEKIRALALRWGSAIDVPYAEVFEVIKIIR